MSSESVNKGSNAHCLPLVDVNAKLLTERNKNLPALFSLSLILFFGLSLILIPNS